MARKGCLGCSFPIIIGALVVLLVFFVIGLLSGPIGKGLFGNVGLPSWISVPQPKPELPPEPLFYIAGAPITNSVVTGWLSIIVLVGISLAITRRRKIIPGRLQAAGEYVLGYLLDFCRQVAGEENGRRFFPLIATIFLFVITNAWLSLLPGWGSILISIGGEHEVPLLRGPNTDANLPLALALVSFIMVAVYGVKAYHGLRYFSKFFPFGRLFSGLAQLFRGKPKAAFSGMFMGIIDLFVGALELLSEFIRILSFTFRLFGNMTAGEILILMIMFLVPWGIAPVFYGLELLVGYIQALIFAGLTLVFLSLGVAHHD